MRVFVTGATGYIGNAVARAFRLAGHRVHGLVRGAEKARSLAAEEIVPVLGDLADPAGWRDAAAEADVLVHCAFETSREAVERDRTGVEALLAAAAEAGEPRTVVYTSGVWVYGSTGDEVADEERPLAPIPLVGWRVAHERQTLAANDGRVRTLVLRPGCVYGRAGSLTGFWFATAAAGRVEVVGDGRNRWAMVHLDDLADAYVRAVASELAGVAIDVADASRTTVGEMAAAAARAAGSMVPALNLAPEEAGAKYGPLAQGLLVDVQVSAARARDLLGWRPRRAPFVADADVLFAAWRAHAPA